MSYLMGIDLGTSSVKAIIMDLEGNILGLAQEDYNVCSCAPGWAEQDIEVLWKSAEIVIKKAVVSAGISSCDIKSIGLSGQMHGLVILDKKMKPIRPAIIWADQRSKQQIDKIYSIIGKDEFRKVTLNSLSTGFFVCSLMWVKDNEPENYNKIYKAVLPKDYIRFKLCGELATDVTDAASTGIFDIANRQWAFDLIDRVGIDSDLFPSHYESYQAAGEITDECAKKTGLCITTQVVYGGGDSLMHSVGNGIVKPGVISANIGTAGQLSSAVDHPVYDKHYRTNTFCHVRENLWIIFGGHLNGGIIMKWLRDNYFPHLSYEDFSALVEEVPAGSDGTLFLPYLTGERTPYHDPFAKGIFFGMTLTHNYKHMIKAAMEGVVMSLRLTLEIFREMGIPMERIVASGGGAKSSAWLQIQSDIFDAPIYTIEGKEEACRGAAITAGVGAGIYESFEKACENIVKLNQKITLPDKENVKVYDDAFEKYKLLYRNNKDLFRM